jgi:ATP-dependent Clp protease ATP-binding subunit ClpC
VFERFTERARQVVVLAQDEARKLRHNYIGTEHLLLGLLREEEGLGARVLASFDITLERARDRVAEIIGEGEDVTSGQIPFTPRSKKVLELSLREALSLGHNYIGTEHVLLGLAREEDGMAARILRDFGAEPDAIRAHIVEILGVTPAFRPTPMPDPQHRFETPIHMPRRWSPVPALLVGWALGAVTLGAGILIGWAIWG